MGKEAFADDDNEFGATTNVMGSGLLRVLKQSSTATGAQQAIDDEPQIEVVVEPPPVPPMTQPVTPLATPPAPPEETIVPEQALATAVVPETVSRRSPVMVGSLVVAAIVLAADFWIFVIHRRPPHVQPAPQPSLPTYVVLPATAPPVHPVLPDPPSAVASIDVVTPAPPAVEPPALAPPPVAAAKGHHHTHHHHSRSSH